MKRLLLALGILGTLIIAGNPHSALAGGAEIDALIYPYQGGQPCAANVCKLHLQQDGHSETPYVVTGQLLLCNIEYTYWGAVASAYKNCLNAPYWWNAWKSVLGAPAFFTVWATQACPGGGQRVSSSRHLYVQNFTDKFGDDGVSYVGSYQPSGGCLPLGAAPPPTS